MYIIDRILLNSNLSPLSYEVDGVLSSFTMHTTKQE